MATWGLIGIGKFADQVIAPALCLSSRNKLIGVCSRDLGRAEAFAQKHRVPRAFNEYNEMLADGEINVIYVASPNYLHAEHAIAAANAGKAVFCEKPMALTDNECKSMINACAKNGVKLGIDFQNRYHPAHVRAHEQVKKGNIGDIYLAKAQYCRGEIHGRWTGWRDTPELSGGGALLGTGIHPIDLLRFILDSEIIEVSALCKIQTPYHKVDEMAYVNMRFDNGILGIIISGILAPRSDNDLVLYGSKKKVTCKNTVGMLMQGDFIIENEEEITTESFSDPHPVLANYVRAIEAFGRCVEEDTESDIPGSEGLRMVQVANAMYASSQNQGQVVIVNYS